MSVVAQVQGACEEGGHLLAGDRVGGAEPVVVGWVAAAGDARRGEPCDVPRKARCRGDVPEAVDATEHALMHRVLCVHLLEQVVAGAGCGPDLAVSDDGRRRCLLLSGGLQRIDPVVRELPRHEAVEPLDGRCGDGRIVTGLAVVTAEHGHADRTVVVTGGVRTDDGSVDATGTALEHAAEPIDEEVVADVVPSQGVRVVAVDPAEDRRDLLSCVVVARRSVVDDGEPGSPGEVRAPVAPGLVGAPLGPHDDAGAERCRMGCRRVTRQNGQRRLGRAYQQGTGQACTVHQVGTNRRRSPAAHLKPAGLPHPHRLRHASPGGDVLAVARRRPLSDGGDPSGDGPGRPGLAVGGCAELDRLVVAEQLETDQTEGNRRLDGLRHSAAGDERLRAGRGQSRCEGTTDPWQHQARAGHQADDP